MVSEKGQRILHAYVRILNRPADTGILLGKCITQTHPTKVNSDLFGFVCPRGFTSASERSPRNVRWNRKMLLVGGSHWFYLNIGKQVM